MANTNTAPSFNEVLKSGEYPTYKEATIAHARMVGAASLDAAVSQDLQVVVPIQEQAS